MIDESKRQKRSEAVAYNRNRMHVEIDEENYEYFPAEKQTDYYDNDVNQRVAIYARVSTGDERQTTSFELQQIYYKDFVERHPNWTLVKIYADEGISGTSLAHRDAFNQMIADCRAGKIDLIITKSVSRFARNVMITIGMVRELAEMKPPVGVFFESEAIFSLNEDSQMALSFQATMAEEESHTRSRSMETSLRMRLDHGIPLTPKLLGYGHDSKGNLYMLFTDAMYGGSSYRGVALRPNGPDVDGKDIGKATFNSGGNLVDAGLFPVAYGKIEQGATSVGVAEAWYVKYSSAWGDGTALIKAKFFGAPPMDSHGYSLLKIQIERGQNMQSLQATGYADIPLGLIILIDGKYYDANYENLHDDYTINSVTISGQSGKIVPNKTLNNTPGYEDCDVDGFFIKIGYAMARTIEVRLVCFQTSSLSDNEILKISEISLNDPGRIDEQFNRYYEYLDDTIVIDGNSAGIYSEDISINFNNYSMSRGDHAFGVKGNGPIADYPTYPYMFQPLTVLQQKVRRSSLPNFNEYAALWTYWINGWRWRMIAKSFRMRDDEYTVTLARSITLE